MHMHRVLGTVALGIALIAGGCRKVHPVGSPPPPPPAPPPVGEPAPPVPPLTLYWTAGAGISNFVIDFTVSPCVGGTTHLVPTNGVASCPALPGPLVYDGTMTINGDIAMHVKSCSACGGMTEPTLSWSTGANLSTFVINFTTSPCAGGTMQLGPTSSTVSCTSAAGAGGQLIYNGTITMNGGIAMHVKSCSACGMPGGNKRVD
jgi:hypothetical protein